MEISSQEQDEFAIESHRRAINAINNGLFEKEIAPISIEQRRGDPIIIDIDEHPRYRKEGDESVLDTSIEDMGKLRPAFSKDGTVKAGNSSGINDGAPALLMMSADRAKS